MDVKVRHNLETLQADLTAIAVRAPEELRSVVKDGIKVGNELAMDFARRSSGTHARKYPGSFSSQMGQAFHGAGVSVYQGQYGPRAQGQGNLAPILERGSRNNKAHRNLDRSADTIGPAMAGEVGRKIDRWFW